VRRRRRSTFSSGSIGRVRWLEPVERRQRRRTPVVPILLFVVVLALAAAAGWFLLSREAASDRRQEAVERFTAAWARGDHRAMWRLVSPEGRKDWPQSEFAASYRIAGEQATVEAVEPGRVGEISGDTARVPVTVRTRDFGPLRGTMAFKVVERDGEPYVEWSPAMRLPGLRDGERVRRRVLERTARRPIFAADGSRLESVAPALAGTPPAAGEEGSGLEALYDERLGGRPGAELRFGRRIVRRVEVKRGRSLHTTLSPRTQRAATEALGDRVGGVAVLRPGSGRILALSGLALTGPQPPGSTFKIITLAGALQARVASPASSYPVQTGATLSGVRLANASNESCGGSLATSFAHSCNSVFAPLGAKLGA
jgi:peptidoglycan glycosyltransferase